MNAAEKQAKAIGALQSARRALLAAAQQIPTEKRAEVFLGSWSVMELLAHLSGWDAANQQAIAEVLAGALPAFYQHHDRDWASFNARLVHTYRCEDFDAQLAQVHASHLRLVAALQAVAPADFVADRGARFKGVRVTVERLALWDAKDVQAHTKQILEWLSRE
jgi:hypothetical protein